MLFVKWISKLSPVTVKNTFARNYRPQHSTSETFISRAGGKISRLSKAPIISWCWLEPVAFAASSQAVAGCWWGPQLRQCRGGRGERWEG